MRVLCAAGSQIINHIKPLVVDIFPNANVRYVTLEELKSDIRGRLKEIRVERYDVIVLATYDLEVQQRQEEWQVYLALTRARKKLILDLSSNRINVSWTSVLLQAAPRILYQRLTASLPLRRAHRNVKKLVLETRNHRRKRSGKPRRICYLRTDHCYGIKAGGSVTHIAGVAKGFTELGCELFFVSTDKLELVDDSKTPVHVFKYKSPYSNIQELPQITYSEWLGHQAAPLIEERKPDLIYQRYALFNYTGVILARRYNLPFVLEFNGSEVWVAKNWGVPLKNQELAEEIELLNLRSADLVVVISEAVSEQVRQMGIGPEKILVNPNGVDVERLYPQISGSRVRAEYGLKDKLVAGFIGTFGQWHGAEVLARAVKPLVEQVPELRFLFVGDGVMMPKVNEALVEDNAEEFVILTGMVPQEQAPEYLAACDILVSPHVPNKDGSKFFGSPTKLFEYMAMGRAIVASDLDQIGEVLTNERNALLVKPGSVDELVKAIVRLTDPDLRQRLADQARRDAVKNYTWTQNAKRVIDALDSGEGIVEIQRQG